ncbi:MAG: HAMP domain-containing protein [Deltaproteobacteria bacterium]|jgi:phosphoserine phosphatase RsbU/P|nr:HAMP domain-containing protein [Deltaproteobacteria bacterium]
MKIRSQLLVFVLSLCAIIIFALISFSVVTVKATLVEETEERAKELLTGYAWKVGATISSAETVAKEIAVAMETFKPNSVDDVKHLIKRTLEANPHIFGSTVAFEPGKFQEGRLLLAPYYYRKGDSLVFVELGTSSYNYPERDWYKIPMNTKIASWDEPYFDEGGGEIAMVTYSQPFFKDGEFWGVATVDLSLDEITKAVETKGAGDEGFVFLLGNSGKFLSKPRENWQLKRTILDIAKESGIEDIKELGIRMMSGKSGFTKIKDPITKEDAWIAYGSLPGRRWSLGVSFPEKFVMAPIAPLYYRMILIGVVGMGVLGVILAFAASYLTKPLHRFTESAKMIAAGDFSLPPTGSARKDEIGDLARAFRDVEAALSDKKNEL